MNQATHEEMYFPDYDDSYDHNNIEVERAYRAACLATVNEFHEDWFSKWYETEEQDFPPIAKREAAIEKRFKAKQEYGLSAADLAYLRGVCHAWEHGKQLDEIELTLSEQNGIVRMWKCNVTQWANREIMKNKCEPPPMPHDFLQDDKTGPTIPEYLLHVPGFISDVIEYTMATATYPNRVTAFCGAITLISVLTGRKIRDEGDLRTNLFVCMLANSGSGKNAPRNTTDKILTAAKMGKALKESFASAGGLEDALTDSPACLFQIDEIDGMIRAIKAGKQSEDEKMLSLMLRLKTSANMDYRKRCKAGKQSETISQPHLVLLGSCVPTNFYEALDSRLVSNGFIARLLVFDAGKRGDGQQVKMLPIPDSILRVAEYWRDFNLGVGNLSAINPPYVVPTEDDASAVFSKAMSEADSEYRAAESDQNNGAMSVWARVLENAKQLALLYACSENHCSPMIGTDAAEWGVAVAMRQARFTLERVAGSVADNPFDELCMRFLGKLKDAGGSIEHSTLLKKMRIEAKQFKEVVKTLIERKASGRC